MPRPDEFHVFDTTLRDGAQREGISYSVKDKLAVARLLDDYGVGFIEGGWPGAMPKDTEFFERSLTELNLRSAQLVAFGATRKPGVDVREDGQVRALLASQAPVITLVAKSDVRHVFEALRTTLDENVAMVSDTVAYLAGEGRRVFVDMEHFFDGYKHDPDYGVRLLVAAAEAGASVGVLCDTHGGRALRRPARHPLPGRHRLCRREHDRRCRGRGDPRAGDGERLWGANGQCRPLRYRAEPAAQAGHRLRA